jgi:hypothetical protein
MFLRRVLVGTFTATTSLITSATKVLATGTHDSRSCPATLFYDLFTPTSIQSRRPARKFSTGSVNDLLY